MDFFLVNYSVRSRPVRVSFRKCVLYIKCVCVCVCVGNDASVRCYSGGTRDKKKRRRPPLSRLKSLSQLFNFFKLNCNLHKTCSSWDMPSHFSLAVPPPLFVLSGFATVRCSYKIRPVQNKCSEATCRVHLTSVRDILYTALIFVLTWRS